MISQCMNEREQFKLMHIKNDLRRIMVLSNMTKFRLANPCQNKESKQKKHDKRDKRNTNEIEWMSFNMSLRSETWQTPLSP